VRGESVAIQPTLGVRATVDLPADARSAGRARLFVGQFCASAGLSGDIRRTASLLVSELVTNAIVHGRSGAVLDAEFAAGVLRVSVSDDSPAPLPAVDLAPRTSAEGGRGLLIVSLLATRWGVQTVQSRVDGGKTVWFELDG
jgi:anti-sigma regulatory factor (Ser/Thr protein kinase)